MEGGKVRRKRKRGREISEGHESKKRQDGNMERKRKNFPEGKDKQRENGEKAKKRESRLTCPGF